jgi:hypothetical protein
MAKQNNPDAQKIGQHEDIIDRLDKGFKAVLSALEKPGSGSQTVVVQLDMSTINEILGIVKSIRHAQGSGGGLTPAEETALAEKLNASESQVQAAVEANQP